MSAHSEPVAADPERAGAAAEAIAPSAPRFLPPSSVLRPSSALHAPRPATISIAAPAVFGARVLSQVLESVGAQGYPAPVELLVVGRAADAANYQRVCEDNAARFESLQVDPESHAATCAGGEPAGRSPGVGDGSDLDIARCWNGGLVRRQQVLLRSHRSELCHHLPAAGCHYPVWELLWRWRPELEPDRSGYYPLRAARPAAGDPLGWAAYPRLPLCGRWRRCIHAAGGEARREAGLLRRGVQLLECKHYSHYGFGEFAVAVGYRSDVIKRYFLDQHSLGGHLSLDLTRGTVLRQGQAQEPWMVHLVETGDLTQTGGRVKRLKPWLGNEPFMLTYGDGVSSVDLHALLEFHRSHGKIATLTAVRPPARFGSLVLEGAAVSEFQEKSQTAEGWINGGYMVFEPEVFNLITSDETVLESDVLRDLAARRELAAYRHEGFWQCMDTLRDRRLLEGLWNDGQPPWKVWE